MPQQCLLGNLPGFTHSHDGFPQPGDLFWSPADWAWTGGLMDALLPTLYFGQPIVGYRGRFDPERALRLIERYQIRNTFLFPTALKLMMKAFPQPRDVFDINLRSIMSAGEAVGTTVFEWARDALGVTINEMFGQTEMNYIVGNSQTLWPAKPGSMGRPYPGHRIAVLDDDGNERPRGETGRSRDASHALRTARPIRCSSSSTSSNPEGTRSEVHRRLVPHRRRRDVRTTTATSGTRDAPTTCSRRPVTASGHPRSRTASCAIRRSPTRPSSRRPTKCAATSSRRSSCSRPGTRRRAQLEADIAQHVRKHLAPYEYPKEIEFIDALPMTTTGKVQRKVLREREAARKAARHERLAGRVATSALATMTQRREEAAVHRHP